MTETCGTTPMSLKYLLTAYGEFIEWWNVNGEKIVVGDKLFPARPYVPDFLSWLEKQERYNN